MFSKETNWDIYTFIWLPYMYMSWFCSQYKLYGLTSHVNIKAFCVTKSHIKTMSTKTYYVNGQINLLNAFSMWKLISSYINWLLIHCPVDIHWQTYSIYSWMVMGLITGSGSINFMHKYQFGLFHYKAYFGFASKNCHLGFCRTLYTAHLYLRVLYVCCRGLLIGVPDYTYPYCYTWKRV